MIRRSLLSAILVLLTIPVFGSGLNLGQPTTQGMASFYGHRFQGRRMANGHKFDRNAYTAASRAYPLGTVLSVRYPRTGLTITVVVTDREPYRKHRVLDLAERPAKVLGLHGVGYVEIRPITLEDLMRGNCYVTCEALYHLIGGKEAGWVPQHMKYMGDTHWFLLHEETQLVLDPTAQQFKIPPNHNDYMNAVGSGFLTKKPSKRAQELMEKMLWQPQEQREF